VRTTRLAAALALPLLAACKDSARSAPQTAAATPTPAAPAAAPAAAPPGEPGRVDTAQAQAIPTGPIQATCEPVNQDLLKTISAGIQGVSGRAPIAEISHAFAIKDPQSPLYYVSGTVTSGAGGVPYVMTWATQSLQAGQGLIFAVTPGARAITIFPDSLPTVHPSNTAGAAVASRQCVMKATGVTKGL
jgi:hypothetical protein